MDAVTNNRLDFDAKRDNTNDRCYIDLLGQTTNDAKWTLDFKVVISSSTFGSATLNYISIGITDEDPGGDSNDIQYCLAFEMEVGSSSPGAIMASLYDNDDMFDDGYRDSLTVTFTTGTYYVRIIRHSATSAMLYLYSDAERTLLIESQAFNSALDALVANLRYLQVINFLNATTSTNTIVGYVEDVIFYDGIDKSKSNPAIT